MLCYTCLQETIRREFSDCTVITVAHRLETIMDCDRVAVLSAGRVEEAGAPGELLADPGSAFRALVDSVGRKEEGEQ